MQRAAISASLFLSLVVSVLFWSEHTKDAREKQKLMLRLNELAAALERIQAQMGSFSKSIDDSRPAGARPSDGDSDILRLRGAISELRKRTEELEKAAPPPRKAPPPFVYPDSIAKNSYANAGFETPAAGAQTVLWAIGQMDRKAFEEAITPEFAKVFLSDEDLPPNVMPGGFRNGAMYRATGFHITEEAPLSADETRVKVFLEGANTTLNMMFKKVDGEWKWSGNWRPPTPSTSPSLPAEDSR
jgi:hypothetical protein